MWNFKKEIFKNSNNSNREIECQCFTLSSNAGEVPENSVGSTVFEYLSCETNLYVDITVQNDIPVNVCAKSVIIKSGDEGFMTLSFVDCCQ